VDQLRDEFSPLVEGWTENGDTYFRGRAHSPA